MGCSALALLALAVPATAAPNALIGTGPFTPRLIPDEGGVYMPQVVASPNGDGTVFWQQLDLLTSKWTVNYVQIDSHYAVDGTVSAASYVSNNEVRPDPLGVAAGPDGAAAIAQHYYDGSHWRIRLGRIDSTGRIGTPLAISAATKDSNSPLVGLDSKGNGVVAWLTDETGAGGWVLHWCTYSAAGKTGAIQSANAKTTTVAGVPSISTSPAGVTTIAYRLRDVAKAKYSLQAIRIGANGKLAKSITVSAASPAIINTPAQATALNGYTALTWSAPSTSGNIIKVAMINPSGVVKVSNALGDVANNSTKPKIAVGSSGAAAVVWQEEGTDTTVVRAARITTAASASVTSRLSVPELNALDPQVSAGYDGSAVVSWTYCLPDFSSPINGFVRYGTRGGMSPRRDMTFIGSETASITATASPPSGHAIIASQIEGTDTSQVEAWYDL